MNQYSEEEIENTFKREMPILDCRYESVRIWSVTVTIYLGWRILWPPHYYRMVRKAFEVGEWAIPFKRRMQLKVRW